ncbi:MAG: tRNA (adenosine(37)-N6)-threonylcarbamoyltransferase complex transferase subunit TsaD [Thermoleophilia bacterium]|nr:tRNA (adenosine(37)-N6)-threonylcarbamoyltransferase complex transferase subunit TsaD [Thermoleophilia bacterium]
MNRLILAIESSCDETAAAVVRGREVLGDVIASQAELHERFGGVVPEIASRRHLELLDVVVREALEQAGIAELRELDAIAVTRGPGLVGALLVGVAGAKARSWASGVPLIAVDHLLGHVASALLDPDAALEPPYLCLLASGGHTLLLDVDADMRVTLLGTTRDDAAGEAFDKGARLLGLQMPGGPNLAALAATGDASVVRFTPAMVHHEGLDTSFSGLKTALSVSVRERAVRGEGFSDADLAAGYEVAIVATLTGAVRKLLTARGARSGHPHARDTLAVVGGVAANTRLRAEMTQISEQFGMRTVATPLRWCGDNAAMIGAAAQFYPVQQPEIARVLDAYATSPLFSHRELLPN